MSGSGRGPHHRGRQHAPSPDNLPGRQLVGMLLLARGRRDGLAYFRNDHDTVVGAIAPWVALWLVGVLLAAITHRAAEMLPLMAVAACSLLAPPVLTEALARLWHRREFWPRFAAATFWCEWLMLPVYSLSALVAAILTEAGVPATAAGLVFVMLALGYWIWLHWFIAAQGLRISRLRAAALVAALLVLITLLGVGAQWLFPQLRHPLDVPGQTTGRHDTAPDAPDKAPEPQKAETSWQF